MSTNSQTKPKTGTNALYDTLADATQEQRDLWDAAWSALLDIALTPSMGIEQRRAAIRMRRMTLDRYGHSGVVERVKLPTHRTYSVPSPGLREAQEHSARAAGFEVLPCPLRWHTFRKGNLHVWEVRGGWMTARLMDGWYQGHYKYKSLAAALNRAGWEA